MAEMDLSLAVAKIIEEARRAGGALTDEVLNRVVNQIAASFQAKHDEVALLRLSSDGRTLSFLYPLKLAKVGSIPMTAAHSLATKTIRDKKGEIVNNFPTYKHPTVFEAVDLSQEEKATPIQKIVSVPMVAEGKSLGVIQVSRKQRPREVVGADFTQADLSELMTVGGILGKAIIAAESSKTASAKP